jgi:tetratricopeptide (TPR) repeat protein
VNPTLRPASSAHAQSLRHAFAAVALAFLAACGSGSESNSASPEASAAAAGAEAQANAPGEAKPAVRGAAEVLREDPCIVEARAMISEALHGAKRYAEQLKLLEGGTRSCPDKLEYQNDFAYLLATLPDDSLRDGKRALEIARAIVAKNPEDPAYLDTLAAAHAETGNFEEAVQHADAALAILAKSQAPAEIVAIFQSHHDAFASKKPVRE